MWGKILGALFGMALLKIPGLLLGLLVGHWFDKSYGGAFASRGGFNGFSRDKLEAQGIFRYNTFAVMGHIAKSNGVVTRVTYSASHCLYGAVRSERYAKTRSSSGFPSR